MNILTIIKKINNQAVKINKYSYEGNDKYMNKKKI